MTKRLSGILILFMTFIIVLSWSYCTQTDPYNFPDDYITWLNKHMTSTDSITSNSESSTDTISTDTIKTNNPTNPTSANTKPDTEKPIITKVEIDGGASVSSDLSVVVVILAEDDVAVTEMRISNDGGLTWGDYIPYFPVIIDHNLASGNNGIRAVYVQVRDAAGNESVIGIDTINYLEGIDTESPTINFIALNNGDISTASSTANVVIDAIDDVSITMMSYSTDGINFSSWELYKQIFNVTLAGGGDGLRYLYIKVKDGADNVSEIAFDSISYLSNIYVDASQDLGNPCSLDLPCKTITEGIVMAKKLALNRINVKKGNYKESTSINSEIELLGGWNSNFTVRNAATNITKIEAEDGALTTISVYSVSTNAVIDGFNIYGPSISTSTTTPTYAIYCSLGGNITIKNNTIIGSIGDGNPINYCYGIYVTSASSPIIKDNNITGYTGTAQGQYASGIYITGNICNPLIEGNKIKGSLNTSYNTPRYGIYVDDNANPTINNNIEICGQEQRIGYGIFINNASATITNNLSILGSETIANSYGIYLDNSSQANITGNTIKGCKNVAGYGIYIKNNSQATIDSNPLISGGTGINGYGIHFDGSTDTNVTTLNITNNTKILGSTGGGTGIYFLSLNSKTINITNNAEISGSDGGSNTAAGISCNTTISNSSININDNTKIIGTKNLATIGYGIVIYNNGGTTNILRNGLIAGSESGYNSGTYYGLYVGHHNILNIKDTVTGIYGSKGNADTGYAIFHYNSTIIGQLNIINNPVICGIATGIASGTAAGIYTSNAANISNSALIKDNALIQGTGGSAANAYGIEHYSACSANPYDITNNAVIMGAAGNTTTEGYGIYFRSTYTGTISGSATILGVGGNSDGIAGGIRTGGGSITVSGITSKLQGADGNCVTCYGIYAAGSDGNSNADIQNIAVPIRACSGDAITASYGLSLIGTWGDVAVQNNTIQGCSIGHYSGTAYGLEIGSILYSGLIKNNTIFATDIVNTYAYGISISGAQGSTELSNNSIIASNIVSMGAKSCGIYLNAVSNGLSIKNNTTIKASTSGGNGGSLSSPADNQGIYITGTSAPTIEHNPSIIGSVNSPGVGIYITGLSNVAGYGVTIDSNIIRGSASSVNNSYGIHQINIAANVSIPVTAKNNIIKASEGNGYACRAYAIYCTVTRYHQDIIANNILYGGGSATTAADASCGVALYNSNTNIYLNPRIVNNIIYNTPGGVGNYTFGIAEYYGTGRANPEYINNNLVFNNDYFYYDENATARSTLSNLNTWNECCGVAACTSNNITTADLPTDIFLNLSSSDYHPKTGASPQVGIGMDTSSVSYGRVLFDYDNNTRPASGIGYDAGPFEN